MLAYLHSNDVQDFVQQEYGHELSHYSNVETQILQNVGHKFGLVMLN